MAEKSNCSYIFGESSREIFCKNFDNDFAKLIPILSEGNLNKENNWKLQHALNGGEVRIGNYWVDGYDKINKIIFEYDERKHYISGTNILKQKDINRQNKILSLLGDDWTLYRYNENLNIFYKVQ